VWSTRPMRSARLVVLVALVAVVATACHPWWPPRHPGHPGPKAVLIPCAEADERVVVTASSVLDPSCTYRGGFEITASNVTLDCRGALVSSASPNGVGIEVSTPVDADLSGVTIRSCKVRGFLNSMRVTRVGFRTLTAGHEYDHAISGVVIEDSDVGGSQGVGIYVDAYVTHTTIRHTTIVGAGSTGIYLEAGSTDNVVEHNTIRDNGFVENSPAGQLFTFNGVRFRFWGTGREGIAVDGSRRNRIAGNVLSGNSAGGIFVYTNCGENVHVDPQAWIPRPYGADDNVIAGNVFGGGVNGVWIGARMGENVLPMDCSDPEYAPGITLDRAPRTTVAANTFRDVVYGVRVEDDQTKVIGNRFVADDAGSYAVVVGTPYRTQLLQRPVAGTVLTGNRSTITGNPSPYRWVDGEQDSRVFANVANGRFVGWCRSQDLPRGPFVMALAIALEPAGSPVTPPPPGLKPPTVGPQPACT
jgi:parallel beta-helix repeat protein